MQVSWRRFAQAVTIGQRDSFRTGPFGVSSGRVL